MSVSTPMTAVRWCMLPLVLHAFMAAAAAPPALEVQLPDAAAAPGTPYAVRYVIRWEGSPSDWAIIPPKIEAPDWGSATLQASESSTTGGVSTVAYVVAYVPESPGTYSLPELAFFYDPPAELADTPAEEAEATEGGAALIAERIEIEVSPPPPLWLVPVVIAAGLLSLGVILLILRRRSRQKRKSMSGGSHADPVQEALHMARRRRLDGDLYAYYRELVRATELIPDDAEAKQLLDKFRTRTQDVGYKGMRPSDDILEGDMRDVERILARRKEDLGA